MGTSMSREEHQKLLEVMKTFNNSKTRTYLPADTSYEQIMKELETSDEVILKLPDGTVLTVCQNFKYYVNGVGHSLKPTDTEQGSTYEQGIKKSNNYTAKQQFEKVLKQIIKSSNISTSENI